MGDVVVGDVVVTCGDDDSAASSPPVEQPARPTPPATATATMRRERHLRMGSIYATLAGVMERTVVAECCRA
ncbi:hypothetical protein NIIDNTM18_40270 [Mycolicibacterium litorale]|uniref:Uncharacterized protein n=1 Tax=Mycolicibacterium litorale TaxID=758802 RepID=A0A6S6P8L5_9MYCO|nr:hypothetical protein NIIDNTM18_40270 [Mycolicibacterium litorale]